MGFYLRKSVSVGPFRFNLSNAGVGMSVGMRGFRVGTGPRGNYVRVGMGGVYYQRTLSPAHARIPIRQSVTQVLAQPLAQPIESASARTIVDASSEALLNEIREKQRTMGVMPLALIGSIVLIVIAAQGPAWLLWPVLAAAIVTICVAAYRDRVAKTVVVMYDLEPQMEASFRRFTEWADAVASCRAAWHVDGATGVHDRKYHAGANRLVRRQRTALRSGAPPYLKTNVPVLQLGAGAQTLYFLPDRLLVYDAHGVGAIGYRTLDIAVRSSRFIEDEGVPGDATVVDYTWKYVNRDGGPDRRFSVNPRLPICLYDELHLRTSSGLNEVVQLSRSGVASGFAEAVRHLGSVVR